MSPSELVRFAHQSGVTNMALSDHDATDGVDEAARVGAELGIRVIPAIELSTDLPGASIHVLGHFLEHHDSDFQKTLRGFRDARLERAEQMVKALDRLGVPITLERVFENGENLEKSPRFQRRERARSDGHREGSPRAG